MLDHDSEEQQNINIMMIICPQQTYHKMEDNEDINEHDIQVEVNKKRY